MYWYIKKGNVGMGNDEQDLNQKTKDLHKRMVVGDVTATVEIAELMLPILTSRLNKAVYPSVFDNHLIDTAVTDALLNYFANPNQFQPEIKSLTGYLLMSAKGDLLNYLHPRKLDEISVGIVEDVEHRDTYSEETIEGSVIIDDVNVEEEAFLRLSPINSQIQELFTDPKDQELASMIIDEIRETNEYANVLGINHLSFAEQQEIVKKHKDRIKKIITRKIDPKRLRNDN